MTATTTPTTDRRRAELPRRVRCPRCGDTGVIERMVPRYIGHGMGGERVYSAVHRVLAREVCPCRQGWNQRLEETA